MATPISAYRQRKKSAEVMYGYVLSVTPSDWSIGTEAQMSTVSDPASTKWKTVSKRDGGNAVVPWHRVETPNDGKTRYFRCRQNAPGYEPGVWFPSTSGSETVSGTPQRIPDTLPGGIQVLFDGTDGMVVANLKPGTPGASTTITKYYKVPPHAFRNGSQSSTVGALDDDELVHGGATGAAHKSDFYAPVVLPPGVTVTNMESKQWLQKTTGSPLNSLGFRKGNSTSAGSQIAQNNLTTQTGWNTMNSTMSEVVSTGLTYSLKWEARKGTGMTGNGVSLGMVTLTYTMDDYSKGL